ncbi:MAG: hypothetical protein M3Y41_07900 [Pseudomonadota bacterium]|nr:hypothetical protein [Pseudomonadota bacterium]
MVPEIVLTDAPAALESDAVEAGLTGYNRLHGIPADWRPLAVLIKEDGRTVAALVSVREGLESSESLVILSWAPIREVPDVVCGEPRPL